MWARRKSKSRLKRARSYPNRLLILESPYRSRFLQQGSRMASTLLREGASSRSSGLKIGWAGSRLLRRFQAALQGYLLIACFLPSSLTAAEPAEKPTTGATSAAARADDKDTPPVQVEDDRAREQAAERAARRTPARLLRGPYLQCGTPQSMMVRWRTDKPSSSLVRFGLSQTNLKFSARSRGLHTD